MYTTLLKLVWPYLMRFATSQAADYIERRREQQLSEPAQPDEPADCPPCPPCPPVTETSSNAFWYSLSGIVLGSTLSVILYILFKEDDAG
jgi:hypothetical protein